MTQRLVTVLLLALLVITACGTEPAPTEVPPTSILPAATRVEETLDSPLPTSAPAEEVFESPLGLPNPASKYCEDQGFKLEMRTDAQGTTGYCIFPDGTECEEWAFFRGECGPGIPEP